MKSHLNHACVFIGSLTAACALAAGAVESSWVYPGADGRLLYHAQPNGDRVIDFSMVGYDYGQNALPSVPTAVTVQPGSGDDTAAIQQAINQVAAMPIGPNGFRGAVQLGAGEFQISSSVSINTSGIVLRGSGQSAAGGTVIRGTGTSKRDLIVVQGSGSAAKIGSSERAVLDKYVPVGATSLRVTGAGSFAVGDRVNVYRPSTQNWIQALGMDQIPPRNDGGTVTQWAAGNFDRTHDRVVTRIEGDRVFLNAPLTQSLDAQYGGGTLYKYNWSGRINRVGIENLRGVSDYDTNDLEDEDHARSLIFMNRIEHGFVRDVTAEHFWFSLIEADTRAKNITVQDSTNLDPISKVTGGRRYAFQNNSQLSLFRDLVSEKGRHDFIQNSPNTGPNVFVDSVAINALDETGPHQRWSTGGLYDNISIAGEQINLRNRGNFGTGHGWAGGNMVVWNATAASYIVQNPPTAQNWLIGSVGTVLTDTRFGPQPAGIVDQHGAAVDTRSLYGSQVADRDRIAGSSLREYHVGDYDEFFADGVGSRDDVFVEAAWQQEAGTLAGILGTGIAGFDDTTGPAVVPFTFDFQVDPGEHIAAATLSVAVRSTGGNTPDDQLFIERTDNAASLSSLGYTSPITTTSSEILQLQLVGVSLADLRDGRLNLMLGADLAVDWARLELIAAPGVFGDFNNSGTLDGSDLDALFAAQGASATPGDVMNLIADGVIDGADVSAWIEVVAGTALGDLDLDGDIDLADALQLQQQYTGTLTPGVGSRTWSQGDLDGDGDVDFLDAITLRQNFTGNLADLAGMNIPEPGTAGVLAFSLLAVMKDRPARAVTPLETPEKTR